MKKTIVITIAMVMIVSVLFINVKAEDTHEQLYDNLNLWGQWQYLNYKGFYLFTTQGTLRHCGENDPGKCSGNPIWCGQPDGYFLNKIAGDVITKEQVMANCPSNRNKGAFLDIYYGTFIEIDMTNRASYTLTAPADIEVYCCQCYTPQEQACRITSCTNGAKEQYVCKDRQLCYSLCQNNQWVDRCEDCPSGKKCVQPQGQSASCKTSECTPGDKDCKSSSVRRTCSNSGTWVESNCLSDQTCSGGVCSNNPPPGPGGNFGTPIYSDKVNDATGQMWLDAECTRSSDCKQITNYSVSCSGNEDITKVAKSKLASDFPDCSSCLSFFGNLQNLWSWISGSDSKCISECGPIKTIKDKWIQVFGMKNDPKGFCIAEKTEDFCKYTEWAAFIKITGTPCTDGIIVIVGGLFILIILMSAIGGRR